jgi:hypothetical protein
VTTNLENDALKALITCEKELQDERNVEETNALLLVNEDLKQNLQVVEEEKRKAKK